MTRKNNTMGGGAKSSLTSSTSVFKPLIASSLALALGVSVATATTCTNSISGAPSICIGDSTTQPEGLQLTWQVDGSNSNIYQMSNGTYNTGDFSFWLENASADQRISIENDPDYSGGYKAKIFGENKLVFTNNGKTIKMGSNGDKTLGTGGGAGTTVIIDFGTVENPTTNYALQGNLFLGGWSGGVVNATFGGKGISGTVDLKGGNNTFIFNGSAKIDGATTIRGSSSNTFNPTASTVFGNTLTVSGGYTTLLTNTNGKQITDMLSATSNTLSGGTLAFAFDSSVGANNKILNLDTSKVAAATASGKTLIITGGTLSFIGAKKVYLNSSTTPAVGDGTLTMSAGAVEFVIDPTVTQANQASDAIVKGNITLNGGKAIFRLKDTSNVEQINTYYADGNIIITNSSISAFWDDTNGFTSKITTTSNGKITAPNGFVGKNDAWFANGTFTTNNSNSTIKTIQGTSGVSHLRFSDAITISNGIGTSGGSNIGTDIYFDKSVTINAFDSSTQINSASEGKAIYANVRASNTIHFAENSTINGDIFAAFDNNFDIPVNTIIASNGLTLQNTATDTMSILLQDKVWKYGGGGKNLFDIAGETTIASNLKIQADSKPEYASTPNYDTVAMHNIFKLNGAVNLTSNNVITSLDAGVGNFGLSGANTYNILSFEADSSQTITIGNINESTFIANRATGYNYIGKGYTTGSGKTLSLNSALFNGTGVEGKFWDDVSHQANVTLSVTGDIFANQGANYINVNSLSTGTITSNGSGKNFINAITFSSGTISTTSTTNTGSKTQIVAQNIVLSGNITTGFGDVYLHSTKTATLKNISATDVSRQGAGVNNILLEGTSASIGADGAVANISVNMTTSTSTSIGHNAIVANATTNTLKLGTISLSGVGGDGRESKTHNIISLNKDSGNTLTATSITSASGMNVIGKNIVNNSGKYNSSLFDSIDDRNPSAKSNFTNLVLTDTYMANVELTLANGTNDALVANGGGSNYINTSSVTITGDVKASGGSNFIRTTSLTINGEINNQVGLSSIFSTNTAELGNVTATNSDTPATVSGGGRNYIVFEGTSAKIGKDSTPATITLNLQKTGDDYSDSGYNTIVSTAQTNTFALNDIILNGSSGSGFNIFSFNNDSATNIFNATNINTTKGSTIIGKNIATKQGFESTFFDTPTAKNPTIKATFANTFMTDAYMAKGTYTISKAAQNAITAGQGGNNYINVENLNVTGNITTTSNGANNIAVAQGTVQGNISGTTNLTLLGNDSTLDLNGVDGGTSHAITSLKVTGSNATLTLDNTASSISTGVMATTIHSITNGNSLDVVLKGQTSKGVTLTLDNASGTTLNSVTLGAGATTDNTLAFGAGSNTILSAISVGANQGLKLDLSGANTSLNLAGFSKGSGSAYVVVNGGSSTLNGGAIEATKLTFAGASTLTINNSSASFADIEVNAGNSTLAGIALNGSNLTFADNTSLTLNNAGDSFALVDTSSASTDKATLTIGNGVNASIDQLKGNNLKVGFNGGATLKINGVDSGNTLTLASVSMGATSTNNTLDLSNLADSVTSVNFASAIAVGASQGLSIKVKGLSSSAGRNIVFGAGISTDSSAEKSALAILDGNATLSATTGGINLTNLDISAKNASSTVTFLSDTTIGTLMAQADNGSNLVVGNANDKDPQHQQTIAYSLTIGSTNSTLNSVTLEGNDTTTLAIKGGTQTINTLTLNASANELNLANNNLTIGEIKEAGLQSRLPFNVTLNNATLSLAGATNNIDSLETQGKSIINLAVGHNGTNKARAVTPKLTIGNLNGDLTANIFVSKSQSDLIKVNATTQTSTTLTLYARGNAGEIISITRNDNVLVADTSGVTGGNTIAVEGGISDIGGLVVALTVEEEKDQQGQNGTGKWYVGKTEVKGVDTSFQEVASSALAVNYDLYLANFNSLNKRMGELRDNPYSQGVWARVFGGAMSNDIGSGSKTQYVTAQAGYDYSLTLGDAKNYMGIAVAYGTSVTKANEGVGLTTAFLDNINSQMVEVGIYNSYVMDSGWYNDTILKFDYIMSDFDISVQSGGTSSHSTNNFAMVLSDEFGYRYKFAENEKGNWYIDPQVEVAFGYFNQSDFNQAIADNFATVEASQDAILTLRTRAGMSLGKKFNTAKGFASLYIGAFYEYDYIEGGNAQTQVLTATNSIDRVESNGRAIVNIGSNIELTEGVRMYIDVEKSFGDKQRTDMQFNFGARYSFGEKVPSTSYLADEKKRNTAPLKVEANKTEK